MAPTAVIMAGGLGRRFGTDKALLELGGITLLERVASAASDAGLEVVVVGRGEPGENPLPSARYLQDEIPGHGPLGGLLTALRGSEGTLLALACDMPLLTAEAVSWLVGIGVDPARPHGTVTETGAGLEPLFSLYGPDVLPLVEERIESGHLSLHSLIAGGSFSRIEVPVAHREAVMNLNTPDDLVEAARRLGIEMPPGKTRPGEVP